MNGSSKVSCAVRKKGFDNGTIDMHDFRFVGNFFVERNFHFRVDINFDFDEVNKRMGEAAENNDSDQDNNKSGGEKNIAKSEEFVLCIKSQAERDDTAESTVP